MDRMLGNLTLGKPGNTGVRRLLLAARCSAMGFVHAWKYEAAFRQEIALTLVLAPPAMLLGRTGAERVILVGSCLLVLIVELLNSAVEATVDRVGDEHHELSGRAKDLGSAAVFVSLVAVATVWVTVAWQRFIG
jgi:diacylglycerol kinase (ATP)